MCTKTKTQYLIVAESTKKVETVYRDDKKIDLWVNIIQSRWLSVWR